MRSGESTDRACRQVHSVNPSLCRPVSGALIPLSAWEAERASRGRPRAYGSDNPNEQSPLYARRPGQTPTGQTPMGYSSGKYAYIPCCTPLHLLIDGFITGHQHTGEEVQHPSAEDTEARLLSALAELHHSGPSELAVQLHMRQAGRLRMADATHLPLHLPHRLRPAVDKPFRRLHGRHSAELQVAVVRIMEVRRRLGAVLAHQALLRILGHPLRRLTYLQHHHSQTHGAQHRLHISRMQLATIKEAATTGHGHKHHRLRCLRQRPPHRHPRPRLEVTDGKAKSQAAVHLFQRRRLIRGLRHSRSLLQHRLRLLLRQHLRLKHGMPTLLQRQLLHQHRMHLSRHRRQTDGIEMASGNAANM